MRDDAKLLAAITCVAMVCDYLISPGLATAVAVFGITLGAVALGWALPRATLRFGWPLLLLATLGVVTASGHGAAAVLKDVWYFAIPMIGLMHGILLAYVVREPWLIAQLIIAGGAVVSLVFILKWILALLSGVFLESVEDLRSLVGAGYGLSALAAIVAIFWLGEVAGRVPATRRAWLTLLAVVNFVAVALSLSRTLVLAVLIALLVHVMFRRARAPAVALIVVGSLGIGVLLTQAAGSGEGLLGSLAMKAGRSLVELVPQEAQSLSELNVNWRGFETMMGLRAFLSGTDAELLLGQGFGATVDLGLVMQLGGRDFDRVPILHNGYVFLLVKTGIMGVLLYLIWLSTLGLRALRCARGVDVAAALAGRTLLSSVLYALVATLVVTGAFNKFDGYPLSLVMGCMCGVCCLAEMRSPRARAAERRRRKRADRHVAGVHGAGLGTSHRVSRW